MKIIFQTKLAGFTPILAQTTGSLSSGASSALGIVMLIGFIFGTICVVGGGFAPSPTSPQAREAARWPATFPMAMRE